MIDNEKKASKHFFRPIAGVILSIQTPKPCFSTLCTIPNLEVLFF